MSSPGEGKSTSAPVQAVHRTMSTLERLADHPDRVTVLELADALQIEKSIASRVLAGLLTLTTRHSDFLGFPTLCHPTLQALSRRTGELVQLAAVDDDHLVLSAYA